MVARGFKPLEAEPIPTSLPPFPSARRADEARSSLEDFVVFEFDPVSAQQFQKLGLEILSLVVLLGNHRAPSGRRMEAVTGGAGEKKAGGHPGKGEHAADRPRKG